MKTTNARRARRPKPEGVSSHENTPQVVVRAGKHYVCSACGTLVEIPADVVGQFVLTPEPATGKESEASPQPRYKSDSEESTTKTLNTENPAAANPIAEPPEPSDTKQPPQRPTAAKPLRRAIPQPQIIDGLRVPSGQQLDRAFKWVAFDLTVLDQKHTEVDLLRKLLKKRRRQTAAPETIHSHADRPVSKAKRGVRGNAGGARPTKTNHGDRLPPDAGPQPNAGQAPAEISLSMAGESVAYESANADSYATDSVTSPTTSREPGAPELTLSRQPIPRGREPP